MTDVERNAILGNVQRQYVGARYVPKFFQGPDGTPTWVGNVPYEALTIVTYLGNSYTSKVPIPAGIGNPSENPTYWALTGNYNAQVEGIYDQLSNIQDMISLITNNQLDWTNIKNVGAYSSGGIDCSSIIESVKSKVIYFPSGTYLLEKGVNLSEKIIIADNAIITSNMLETNFTLNRCTIIGMTFNASSCAISATNTKIIGCNFNMSSSPAGPTTFTIEINSRSQTMLIKDCFIKVPLNVPGGDGIHIYGNVSNVKIEGCYIDTSDDAIALNAREGEPGPISNISITSCTLRGYGVRLYGRGESQKIEDVYINNCLIDCDNIACIRALNSVDLNGDENAPLAIINRVSVINSTITTSKESTSGLAIRGFYTACANCEIAFTNVFFHDKQNPNIFFIPIVHASSLGEIKEKYVSCVFESPNTVSNSYTCNKKQSFLNCEFKTGLVIGYNQDAKFTACTFISVGSAEGVVNSHIAFNGCYCPVPIVLKGDASFHITGCDLGTKANGASITGDENGTYFINESKALIFLDAPKIKRLSGSVASTLTPASPQQGDYYYKITEGSFQFKVFNSGSWV